MKHLNAKVKNYMSQHKTDFESVPPHLKEDLKNLVKDISADVLYDALQQM
jgi:hypothetical protein